MSAWAACTIAAKARLPSARVVAASFAEHHPWACRSSCCWPTTSTVASTPRRRRSSSLTWTRIRRAGRFGVNVLGRRHERFVARATPAGADRFAGLDWELGHGGAPLLTDALASFECEIVAEHPTGDHWIVVGQVDNLRISPVKDPLIFFAGAFRAVR